eukprot:1153504-Pelagomonas_calceolata.AAC.1
MGGKGLFYGRDLQMGLDHSAARTLAGHEKSLSMPEEKGGKRREVLVGSHEILHALSTAKFAVLVRLNLGGDKHSAAGAKAGASRAPFVADFQAMQDSFRARASVSGAEAAQCVCTSCLHPVCCMVLISCMCCSLQCRRPYVAISAMP